MAIEMGKKYRTRDGRDVRILCVDGPIENYPVVGVIKGDPYLSVWSGDGKNRRMLNGAEDLIEISPYSDIAIDAPGWALDGPGLWVARHFAGIDDDGRPMTWVDGKTSHTTKEKINWDEFTTTKPKGSP